MASTSSLRASSSSSTTPSIPQTSTYDVFLGSGADTHYNFTDHLYKALGSRGVLTFRNDNLMRGEAIAPEILKASLTSQPNSNNLPLNPPLLPKPSRTLSGDKLCLQSLMLYYVMGHGT